MIATAPQTNVRATSAPANRPSRQASAIAANPQKHLTEVDARGPTPPKTVPAILAVLNGNPAGRPQFVRTAEAPVELLRALESHGVEAYPAELPDGSWRTMLIFGVSES